MCNFFPFNLSHNFSMLHTLEALSCLRMAPPLVSNSNGWMLCQVSMKQLRIVQRFALSDINCRCSFLMSFLCRFGRMCDHGSTSEIVSVSSVVFVVMGRGRSSIEDVAAIVKIMRAELHGGARFEDFSTLEIEQVIQTFEGFLVAVLKTCKYPSEGALKNAAQQAWKMEAEHCRVFANKMVRCIGYCREKGKHMKDGSRLPQSVKAVCRALLAKPASPIKSPRKRKARKSDESKGSKRKQKQDQKDSSASSTSASKQQQEGNESSVPPMSHEDILALYGIPKRAKSEGSICLPVQIEVESISSSVASEEDEEPGCQVESAKHSALAKPEVQIPWMCNKDLAMKRLTPDGHIESAAMLPGPAGFALALFPDSSQGIETEMPNLVLETKLTAGEGMKKAAKQSKKKGLKQQPKGKAKKQAATKAKAKAKPKAASKAASQKNATTAAKVSMPEVALPSASQQAAKPPSPLPVPSDKPANFRFEAVAWGPCKAEFYSEKSYIRRMLEGKWVSVIGSQQKNHWFIVKKLATLVEAGASKEKLLAERQVLEAPDVH